MLKRKSGKVFFHLRGFNGLFNLLCFRKRKNMFFETAFTVIISTFCFCLNGCNAQPVSENSSLKLVASVPLPNVGGRIDHLSFDSEHQIVFVAALGNNTVEVVDLKSKQVIHSIKNLNEPQGVAFIPESNSLFVTNGDNGEYDGFNVGSFQKTNSIKLSGDADNVRYDAADKKIYVGYGD